MQKWLVAALFSVLLLVPVGLHDAFADHDGHPCDILSIGQFCRDNSAFPCRADGFCEATVLLEFSCVSAPINVGETCGEETECLNAPRCNSSGSCLSALPKSAGLPCGDDGTECINQDICNGSGACTDRGFVPEGALCGQNIDTQCNPADTCDGAGSCIFNLAAFGTACGVAEPQCFNQDTCNGDGDCVDNGFASAGTSCEDGDICTGTDACDGTGICIAGPPLDILACFPDDGALVGGEVIPIETTSLILAGVQSFSWMIPVTFSVLGIGIFVVTRKSDN